MFSFVEIIGKILEIKDFPLSFKEKIENSINLIIEKFLPEGILLLEFKKENDVLEIFKKGKKITIEKETLNRIFIKGELIFKEKIYYFPVKDNYFIYGVLIVQTKTLLNEEEIKFLSIFCKSLSLFFKEHYEHKRLRKKLLENIVSEKKDYKERKKIDFSYSKHEKLLLLKLFSLHERVKIFKVFFCYLKFSLKVKRMAFFKYEKDFIPLYAVQEDDLNFVSIQDSFNNFDKISFNKIKLTKKIKEIGKLKISSDYEYPFCDLNLAEKLKKLKFNKISMFLVKLRSVKFGILVIDGIDDLEKIYKIYILCDLLAGILNYSKKLGDIKLFHKKLEIQEKSSFFEILGEISHEIKNPIMAISGFTNRLLKNFDKFDNNKIQKYLEIISQESQRLEKLLNDLLIFSKTDKISYNPVNIVELVKETVDLIENEIKEKNIKIFFEYKSNPIIFGNKSLLKQVILNILTNSIEAIDKEGKIFIKIKPKEKMCSIIFEDNGCGIPEEILSKIYDPFFSTKEYGTGLGLTVSYRIVQQHGGNIKIKNIENGVRVELILPYRR